MIGNVGDDVELHGLHISPDIDTITYTLAEVNRFSLRRALEPGGRRWVWAYVAAAAMVGWTLPVHFPFAVAPLAFELRPQRCAPRGHGRCRPLLRPPIPGRGHGSSCPVLAGLGTRIVSSPQRVDGAR